MRQMLKSPVLGREQDFSHSTKKKSFLFESSTINVRNGIQATPQERRLYRAGAGFELAIKRLLA
jgi:hypothetical protein